MIKAIDLTKEQEKNLTEMIKKLFPEIKFSGLDLPENGCCCIGWDLPHIPLGEHYDKNISGPIVECIHWYEFCFEHLLSKLHRSSYDYRRWCNEEGKTHIIDYCYRVFNEKYNVVIL